MKDFALKVVRDFLCVNSGKGQRLLLGFSGGVDSSALFSLLQRCSDAYGSLHIAHFDHAWREESLEEARILQKRVEELGYSFHMQRSAGLLGQRSEETARKERYAFFQELYDKTQADALLLAHQREDQAETVLKRVLEGACISACSAMQEESFYEGMRIWRPCLSLSREDLIAWNLKYQVPCLDDYTNRDPHFLRARMREKLFPFLEEWFGKKVQKNLYLFSQELSLWRKWMDQSIMPLLSQKIEGRLGFFLPLEGEDFLRTRETIRLALEEKKVSISRESLNLAAERICDNQNGKQIDVSPGVLYLDKGICWLPIDIPDFPFRSNLITKIESSGWVWEKQSGAEASSLLSFFLSGKVSYRVPLGKKATFTSYEELDSRDKERVRQFFGKNAIPVGIRKIFPLILVDGSLYLKSFYNEECKKDEELDFFSIELRKK